MQRAFSLIGAILAVSISFGWNAPASGAELTPETQKLFDAVRTNNFTAVRRSLLNGADIQVENFSGRTAIDLAIDKGYFPIAHYLLAWRKQRQAANTRPALPPEAPVQIAPPAPAPEAKPEPAPARVTAPEPKEPEPVAATEPLEESEKSEPAAAPALPGPPASPSSGGLAPLENNPFLTTEMSLGKNQPGKSDNICIEKKSWQSLFCIEPVLWPPAPQDIGASFEVRTTLFRGRQTIVRYEKDRATQFHTPFPSKNFYAIVDYFTKRFGPPSEKPGIRSALIGEADRKNRTVRWFGPTQTTGETAVLEVREIDDLRWSAPPDPRYGVVWLYFQGADPVFRYISLSDFLLARVRRTGKK